MNANTDMDSAGQVLDLSVSKSGKSRLARAVVGLLKLSIILGGPIMAADSTWADTGELDTVTTTWNWENPEFFDPWDYVWYPEGGGGGSGDDGGGSGGDEEPPPPPRSCPVLLATKPPNCPNPIPMPSGYGYGRELFASGRALPKVLNFVENQPYVHPDAREWARLALQFQTEHFLDGTLPYEYSSRTFLSLLTAACRVQTREDEGTRWIGTSATAAERACLDALSSATAETNNESFVSFFTWWADKEDVPLTSLGIPEAMVNFLSPQNSIRVKYDAITADVTCSKWWTEVQAQQCNL